MSLFTSRPDAFRKGLAGLRLERFRGKAPYQIPAEKVEEEYRGLLVGEIRELALAALAPDRGENLIALLEKSSSCGPNSWKDDLREKIGALAESEYLRSFEELDTFGFATYPGYLLTENRTRISRFGIGGDERRLRLAYPVLYEFQGTGAAEGRRGWLAFLFVKPQTMGEQKEMVLEKTVEAVKILKKLGSRVTGLGGLLASYTDGGRKVSESGVTTGHNYTIVNILGTLRLAAREAGKDLRQMRVAVVGAAGSVGSGCAELAALEGVKELLLVDPRDVGSARSRVEAAGGIARAATLEEASQAADAVIFATSAHRALLDASRLKPGAIVVDDSQPKNIDAASAQKHPDVHVLEGGAVELPEGAAYRVREAFGAGLLPFDWSGINNPLAGSSGICREDSSWREVPCCMAEAMIWSALPASAVSAPYSLGKSDPKLAGQLERSGRELGFRPGRLQNHGRAVKVGVSR